MQHAAVVGDLVEGQQQEAHVHALYNGPQTRHGSTHAHAQERVFAYWGVQQPRVTQFLVQVERHLVAAAVVPDILACETRIAKLVQICPNWFKMRVENGGRSFE